jgi:small-conductance mechanosensitive channel
MTLLQTSYGGVTLQEWAIGVGIALGVWCVLRLSRAFFTRRVRRLATQTATDLDDLVLDLIQATKWFFLLTIGIYIALAWLPLSPEWISHARHVLMVPLLLQVLVWGNHVIAYIAQRYGRRTDDATARTTASVTVISVSAKIALYTIVILVALDNLGIDITALVAGLGIGGIAVALAVQNILGDLLSSMTILFDKPFVVGDFIIVDTLMGTVEHVGLKTTRIRSLSGEQLIFSNSDLLGSRIRNYKRMSERRVLFTLGVVYQTSAEQLAAIPGMIRAVVESQEHTRFGRVHFKAFGDFSLQFEVVYFMLVPDYDTYMDIQQTINLALFSQFADAGIEFAYPTQTVFLEKP